MLQNDLLCANLFIYTRINIINNIYYILYYIYYNKTCYIILYVLAKLSLSYPKYNLYIIYEFLL